MHGPAKARVTAVWRYPVKSLGGESLGSARVTERGLERDRRWMLTDARGRFLTQREHPALTQLSARPTPGGLTLTHRPSGETLAVARPDADAPRLEATVWEATLPLARASADAEAWLSERLGFAAHLVYQPDDAVRPVDPAHAAPGDHVSLADGYPLLITTTASLADLNRRLTERGEAPVPMDRFRPSLVLETHAPFAEDRWRTLDIGGVRLRLTHPCKRCIVTTTDQQTGARGKEPLRTLATFRQEGGGVLFGMNAVPERLGVVEVGAVAEITQRAT